MQIIESNDTWAVRSARIALRCPTSGTRITLFPMIHIGDPQFYETVYDDAFGHDVVLVEGLRSPVARRITRSYRWIEGSPRIGLAVQPPYPAQERAKARIVRADLDEQEFAAVWRKIPFWVRVLIYLACGAIGLPRRWTATRQSLAARLAMDDLKSRTEIIDFNPELIAIDNAMLHARDARLLDCIGAELDRCAEIRGRVAVVYGAAHMRAALRELTARRYFYVEDIRWLTVFEL